MTRARGPIGLAAAVASAALLAVQGIAIAMFLLLIVVCAAVVLGGCSTMPTVPKTEIVYVDVERTVKCITKAVPVPAWPLDALAADATIWTVAKTALSEIEARVAYEVDLLAANEACK